jgi:hypothetical protein
VFITDNTCAAAMASHLYSRSAAIDRVARQLRDTLRLANAQSFGVHLPGKLNIYTDRPSRAGEELYARAVVHPSLFQWARSLSIFRSLRRSLPLSGSSAPRADCLYLSVPPPHTRESCMAEAIAYATAHPSAQVALLLPDAAYSDGRWTPLFKNLKKVSILPSRIPVYSSAVSVDDSLWVSPLVLPARPSGSWSLWKVLAT